jgi:histidine ammonia-lyase
VIEVDGSKLTTEIVHHVAAKGERIQFSKVAEDKVKKCRKALESILESGNVHIYGVTTGPGALQSVDISTKKAKLLQHNLIRSHAVGVGNPLSEEEARAVMLVLANSLLKGFSAVKLSTVQTIRDMLNKRVYPFILEKGSVGASGDLQPLANLALVMVGEGEAFLGNHRVSGSEALKKAGIKPIQLDTKEGLSLINSTAVMSAIGALAVHYAKRLAKVAEIATAMSLEGLKGILEAFDERIHLANPHKGQIACARNIRRLTEGSELLSLKSGVQGPYSFRCVPQVIGACRDAIAYVERVTETEMNSATDNPLIISDTDEVLRGGNFHGEPVAIAMDLLGIALAEIGNISERQIAKLLDKNSNKKLPVFLIKESPGLNTGLMVCQYTAAALVSENKVLAHPASVDSIPTSANHEDHVSMGTIAARKARDILDNVEKILGIQLLCATQALEFRKPSKFGVGTQAAFEVIRNRIKELKEDRVLYPDIVELQKLIHDGILVRNVEKEIGVLE